MANLHEARTLVDLLSLRARQDPQGIWFTLYGEAVTYQTVQEQSLRYAATLAQSGFGRGDAVALVLPTCQEFFYSFFGALALGAVPVPLYPTLGVEPLGNLFRASEVRAVITIDWLRKTVEEARKESPALEVILTPEELEAPASGPLLPMISEDDVAFIQYTSGSTGAPRGVVLSHRNVLANVRAMVSRAEIRARETVVSWLPPRVLLVRPHTIPKTSSGKIQHQRLTDLLESGALLASVLGRSRLACKLGAES